MHSPAPYPRARNQNSNASAFFLAIITGAFSTQPLHAVDIHEDFKIIAPVPDAGDRFGVLSVSGNTMVVGNPSRDCPAAARDGATNGIEDWQKSANGGSRHNVPPNGLTDSDWTSIRQEYDRLRHAAVGVDGGFQARNSGQQWLTHFDGRGFTVEPATAQFNPATAANNLATAGVEPNGADWRWGLELRSCGFPGHERRIDRQAETSAQHDRVTYDWGAGLQEWFVNDRRGLEHGFTLSVRPPGSSDSQTNSGDPQMAAGDWLELQLTVRGGLRPQGNADGQSVSFTDDQNRVVVQYGGLKVWDADQRELPARLESDAAGLRLAIDERQARYPLTIDPIAQQAYLKASNTGNNDSFGVSVAVSGDTVVVGALGEGSNATGVNGDQNDNNALQSGSAYVFVRNAGVWTQQAYLKASNTEEYDYFGLSVAVSGDTVVVGAPFEDSNATGVNGDETNNAATDSGAAYVFVRNAGVWTEQAYLKASNTGAVDRFAYSVAVSDDTVVVGAVREDSDATGLNGDQSNNSAEDSGAAYVFVRDGGGVWTQQAYLKASNTGSQDRFGVSVAVSGDTVVVGAWEEDSSASAVNGDQFNNSALGSGAAYVFVRDAGVWTQQAYLKASNTGESDQFGYSVAVSGETVVVGAHEEASNATGVNGDETDNSATQAGAAYIFVRNAGVWTQQAYLKASNTEQYDYFGVSVAVAGETVVVGASGERSGASYVNGDQSNNSVLYSGAAYVFVRNAGVWTQQAYLKASNTDAFDEFGTSVAVSGDTVVVGAFNEDSNATGVNGDQDNNNAPNSSAAYVFSLNSTCGNGTLDLGEVCDDGNNVSGDCCSPACLFETVTTKCRLKTGPCDVAEFCDGAGNCPADGFEPATTACRPDTGPCDVTEFCDGAGNCPADVIITMCIDGDGCCPSECYPANDDDCPLIPTPTLSQWGVAILMALMVLTGAAKLYFTRRVMSA